MNRLEKILAAIAAILLLVVGLLWLKPDLLDFNGKAAGFSDTDALAQSEWAKLDIIPAWLPAAATGLKIRRNAAGAALYFRFKDDDLAALREACPRILKPLPELPDDLDAEWKPANPDAFYFCPNGMLAIDGKQRSALLWR